MILIACFQSVINTMSPYKIPHKSCHSFPLFRKVINVMGFFKISMFHAGHSSNL